MLISMSTGMPYDISMYTVCVDSYDNQNIKGSFINNYYSEEILYNSTVELLFKMEDLMNKIGSPKKYEKDRSFICDEKENDINNELPINRFKQSNGFNEYNKKGKVATFYIKVRFRQNSSWQGSITWFEGGKTKDFRSVFELLKIMNSVF